MAEYKDVLRVCDTKVNVAAALKQKMFGFCTDTFEIGVKAPGGTMYYFGAGGTDHFGTIYIDDSIVHYGNDGLHIDFSTNQIMVYAADLPAIDIDYNSAQKAITINGDEQDVDFILLGLSTVYNRKFFWDASTGFLGIGDQALPLAPIDIYYTNNCGNSQLLQVYRSGNVDHGIIGYLPTDAFGAIGMGDYAMGGLHVIGATDGDTYAIEFRAIRGGDSGIHCAPMLFTSGINDTSAMKVVPNGYELFRWANYETVRMVMFGNGDLQLTGDIWNGTSSWIDCSSSLNPYGFSCTPTSYGRYHRVGKLCLVSVLINGTSNSDQFQFQLPFAPAGPMALNVPWGSAVDGGSALVNGGRIGCSPSTTTAYVLTNFGGGVWVNSGTKEVRATIIYEVE